jgi:hypothetical protein
MLKLANSQVLSYEVYNETCFQVGMLVPIGGMATGKLRKASSWSSCFCLLRAKCALAGIIPCHISDLGLGVLTP